MSFADHAAYALNKKVMQIFLSPNIQKAPGLLAAYSRAFAEAKELYVASAYLTDWDAGRKLGSACQKLVVLVGTDFGLTRKAAMLKVLSWIPDKIEFSFFGAVPPQSGGFHPKLIAWRAQSGKCYCLIGSSNLSKAAFSTNYEANVLNQISSIDFQRLCVWLDAVSENSSAVDKDWIKHHYKEARLGYPAKKGAIHSLGLAPSNLPRGSSCARVVRERRQQQSAFRKIAGPIRDAARDCSQRKIRRSDFWKAFWTLWSQHDSRFQGSGIQFAGKSANWEQACGSLVKILNASEHSSASELDQLVVKEIDHLRRMKNPMRGAWLSEMLCHYFPEMYPINNNPVQKWLSAIKWRTRRGLTEGQRYMDLSRKLRSAVRDHHPAGSKNLAELDGAIWQWAYDHGLLKA